MQSYLKVLINFGVRLILRLIFLCWLKLIFLQTSTEILLDVTQIEIVIYLNVLNFFDVHKTLIKLSESLYTCQD
jgi:hypothetical protein